MPSRVQLAAEKDLLDQRFLPGWLPCNIHYEAIIGSVAYGVSEDTSDQDIYGICIPPKEEVFPHLRGHIPGFGPDPELFRTWTEHHVKDKDSSVEYDFQIHSIVKYLHLCSLGNPNMVDSLFVPFNCVVHSTQIGTMIRESRRIFLSKAMWGPFKGYAYNQLREIETKKPIGKRVELVEKYGYDVKYAYHVVRLLNEIEQILRTGDLDLQANKDQLKAIRSGAWEKERLFKYAADKEKSLEALLETSPLPERVDMGAVKSLLVNCLEAHYGDLSKCVVVTDKSTNCLREVREVLQKYGY